MIFMELEDEIAELKATIKSQQEASTTAENCGTCKHRHQPAGWWPCRVCKHVGGPDDATDGYSKWEAM
jgi:ribosomal protein L37AE/L43A